MVKYPIKVELEYVESASRLQLFVRIVIAIVWGIIASIWGFFAEIAVIVQWFYVLIFGRRAQSLYKFTRGFFKFYLRYLGYVYILTDEIPPISGE
ncbi:MAG: DUF4389 domain-containing protein [Candidatus Methanofastidiosia archaeon]